MYSTCISTSQSYMSLCITVDWGFPRQDNHYELEVGSVMLQLSEQRLHVVYTRDIALKEWLLRDGHTGIVADPAKLVDKLSNVTNGQTYSVICHNINFNIRSNRR